MAKPIKETPVLKGKDAEKFVRQMEAAKGDSIDTKTMNRIKENYSKISSLVKK